MNRRNFFLSLISGLIVIFVFTALACEQAPNIQVKPIPEITAPTPTEESTSPQNTPAADEDQQYATIEDNAKAKPLPSIQIIHIHYKGRDYLESIKGDYEILEADEYIEIKNTTDIPQKLTGWKIKNISRGIPPFIFPASASRQYNSWLSANVYNGYPSLPPPGHTPYSNIRQINRALKKVDSTDYPFSPFSANTLAPFTSVRIYTGEYHLESGGFTFYYHPGDIWNNTEPDTAVLYNPQGEEVSRRSYSISDIK